MGQENPEDAILQLIDFVIALEDIAGEGGIAAHESVERIAGHLLSDLRHLFDVDHGLERRRLDESGHVLGDVDGLVADPLEVGAHLHRRSDETQVGSHRLLQGEHLEAAVVDLDLQTIDRGIAFDDGLREFRASLHQGDDGLAGLGLDKRTHVKKAVFEGLEIALEVLAFHYPNLPVM